MNEAYLSLEQIQERGLGMLKFMDEVCRKEHLTYWLSGGTLLGAVRHGDFIPWDDDVDLMMPRPDYERFLRVAPKYCGEDYDVRHPALNPDYAMPYARIWDLHTEVRLSQVMELSPPTLFADIFPVDALPAGRWRREWFFKRVRLWEILLKCARRRTVYKNERLQPLKKAIMLVVRRIGSPNDYARRMDRCAGHLDYERAKYAGVVTVTHYGSRESMPIEVFAGTAAVRIRGGEYPAPAGWDTYLRRLYGDYMTLPPERRRVPAHRLKAKIADPEPPAAESGANVEAMEA